MIVCSEVRQAGGLRCVFRDAVVALPARGAKRRTPRRGVRRHALKSRRRAALQRDHGGKQEKRKTPTQRQPVLAGAHATALAHFTQNKFARRASRDRHDAAVKTKKRRAGIFIRRHHSNPRPVRPRFSRDERRVGEGGHDARRAAHGLRGGPRARTARVVVWPVHCTAATAAVREVP